MQSYHAVANAPSINDYLFDQHGHDWGKLLADWSWLLPSECTVWMVNRFAEMVLVLPDETVHYFDVGGGTLTKVAETRDEFRDWSQEEGNTNDWLMIPLVDKLVDPGILLGVGQCYGFKVPPIMGGDYTVENCAPIALGDYLGAYGSIHEQLRDVPDGTEVVIKVVNNPSQNQTLAP